MTIFLYYVEKEHSMFHIFNHHMYVCWGFYNLIKSYNVMMHEEFLFLYLLQQVEEKYFKAYIINQDLTDAKTRILKTTA